MLLLITVKITVPCKAITVPAQKLQFTAMKINLKKKIKITET